MWRYVTQPERSMRDKQVAFNSLGQPVMLVVPFLVLGVPSVLKFQGSPFLTPEKQPIE